MTVLIWFRFDSDLIPIWFWFNSDLIPIWFWFDSELNQIWFAVHFELIPSWIFMLLGSFESHIFYIGSNYKAIREIFPIPLYFYILWRRFFHSNRFAMQIFLLWWVRQTNNSCGETKKSWKNALISFYFAFSHDFAMPMINC